MYLIYLDCTNLYGTVMYEKLASHGFRWVPKGERRANGKNGESLANKIGRIDESMLSPIQKEHVPKHAKKKYKKLTPNLLNKVKYVVAAKNLRYCEEVDMEVTKVHRIMMYKQSAWLKEYTFFYKKLKIVGSPSVS